MNIIGVDIGGTKITAALVSSEGEYRHKLHQPTSPGHIVNSVEQLCRALLSNSSAVAIGVGSAGQVNVENGEIVYAVDTIPGWAGTPLAAELSQRLSLPVFVENDVNAMALGEMAWGAGRAFQHVLYITVGTGIGGAIVLDGQLWHGANWSAGEIGHILVNWQSERVCNCGQFGHLEAYSAGPGIAQTYQELANGAEVLDLKTVVSRAHDGDLLAHQAIAEGAKILGLALSGLLNTLNPESVIIGGGVAEIGDLWWQPLEAALRSNPMPASQKVILQKAALGVDAVLIGAALLARRRISP